MREKIVQLAKELDYYPNSSARALVAKRVGVIGLIIPRTCEYTFTSPYYSHILLGISSMATQRGYQLMLIINEKNSYAIPYHRRQVDGVIVVGNHYDDQRIFDLAKQNIPCVAVPGFVKDSPGNPMSTTSDNYEANYQALTHLVGLKHRRIAYILGHRNSKYSVERLEVYRDVMNEHGLEIREEYTPYSDFSVTDGFRLTGKLLDMPEPPTALICTNDSLSMGALNQIKARSLRIPQDLSVIVTCASDILSLHEPPLTHIHVPVVGVGSAAAAMLIEFIETGEAPGEVHAIPAQFTVRKSTGINPEAA